MPSHSKITCCSLFHCFAELNVTEGEREECVRKSNGNWQYYAITGVSAVTELILFQTFPTIHHLIERHKSVYLVDYV